MELSEALKRRHMNRRFARNPVEREKLERLVYAANRAPQGRTTDLLTSVVNSAELFRTL